MNEAQRLKELEEAINGARDEAVAAARDYSAATNRYFSGIAVATADFTAATAAFSDSVARLKAVTALCEAAMKGDDQPPAAPG